MHFTLILIPHMMDHRLRPALNSLRPYPGLQSLPLVPAIAIAQSPEASGSSPDLPKKLPRTHFNA